MSEAEDPNLLAIVPISGCKHGNTLIDHKKIKRTGEIVSNKVLSALETDKKKQGNDYVYMVIWMVESQSMGLKNQVDRIRNTESP